MALESIETVTVNNELGLHARAAAAFVKIASKFYGTVTVKKDCSEANGKSITSLIMLSAPKGTTIEIKTEGDNADLCAQELKNLVENKFGEEK